MPHFQGLIFRGELLNVQGWFSYLESFDILMALVWKVPDLLGRFKTTPKNRGWMSQDPGRCIYIQYICVFFVSYIYMCFSYYIYIYLLYIYISSIWYNLFDMKRTFQRFWGYSNFYYAFSNGIFHPNWPSLVATRTPLLSLQIEEIMLMVQKLLKQFLCQISDLFVTSCLYISTVVLDFWNINCM